MSHDVSRDGSGGSGGTDAIGGTVVPMLLVVLVVVVVPMLLVVLVVLVVPVVPGKYHNNGGKVNLALHIACKQCLAFPKAHCNYFFYILC